MKDLRVSKNIRTSYTLPSSFYKDDEIFEIMRTKLFPRSWQLIGDLGMVEKNSAHPLTLLEGFMDEPLLITHTGDGSIQCLSNVCTHRGNILIDKPGVYKKLICGYHGRRFGLDGKFEYMPEFEEAADFPGPCDDLPKVDINIWNQFIFSSLEKSFPFQSITNALEQRVGFLPISEFKLHPERSRDYQVAAHWALYCDNYLEGFHIPFVHHDLNAAIEYGSYETILYDFCNLQIGYSRDETETFILPKDHPDYGKNVAAYYYWIFPNLMLNFYPWGLSVNIVKPLKKDLTKVSYLTYIYDETKIDHSAGALLDKVELEDEEVVQGVQKGVNSSLYKRGRFSPTREQGVHHFHKLLSTFI